MRKNVRGEIAYLFNNCPKADGWFGCIFYIPGEGRVKLTGYTRINLCDHMSLVCDIEKDVARSHGGQDVYVAKRVSLERTAANEALYLQNVSSSVNLSQIRITAFKHKMDVLDMIMNEPQHIAHLFSSQDALDDFVDAVTFPLAYDEIHALVPKLKSNVIDSLVERYKGKALAILKNDPYKPLFDGEKVYGYTWRQAEMVASVLGVPLNGKSRIYSAIATSVTNLHEKYSQVCVDLQDPQNYQEIMEHAQKLLGVDVPLTANDIHEAVTCDDSPLICVERSGHTYVYTKHMKQVEEYCVQAVTRMLSSEDFVTPFIDSKLDILDCINEYESMTRQKLDNGQVAAVVESLTSRMSIVCGGPGCGKTSTIACILYCWHRLTGGLVSLSAPTWMAVKRTRESVDRCCVGDYDSERRVKTVASRIMRGYTDGLTADDYPVNDPLEPAPDYWNGVGRPPEGYQFVLAVIDESSMVSLEQAAKLLSMYRNAQIIWVGDADQLPSINPGDFFGDLCRSRKVPCSVLRINHRAHSRLIVTNSRAVLNGCQYGPMGQEQGVFTFTEFAPVYGKTTVACAEYIADRYVWYIRSGNHMKDITVLAPMKKAAYLGSVTDLNVRIQSKLNPLVTNSMATFSTSPYHGTITCHDNGYEIPGKTLYDSCSKEAMPKLRIGDKVVCVRNRPKQGRVNGDMGIVIEYGVPDENRYYTQEERNKKLNHPYMLVQMFNGTTLRIADDDFGDFELGYATTVHKAQGTGYKIVLFSAQHEPSRWELDFLTRKLFYTAITRAEDTVEVIGSMESVTHAVMTPSRPRFSLIPAYLDEALATHWTSDEDDVDEDVYVDERYWM